MADFPVELLPSPVVLTPWSPECYGFAIANMSTGSTLDAATSITWPTNNLAFYYPFRVHSICTAYQLLFFVGATSSGDIDVAIYDAQKNRIVSAGTTAMSATVNTVQEINITDTVLYPGEYLLGVACSTTAGTVFGSAVFSDERAFAAFPVYEQATALPLPDPAVPVLATGTTINVMVCGIQFRSVF